VDVDLLPSELDMVLAYQKNRVKLVLSLLAIMEKCHFQSILHNDLSPSNIMLHFLPEHSKNVYIRMCDWGLANHIVENAQSLYDYATKAEIEANIAKRKHVAPKLFYVFGPHDSRNSLESMWKKHLYSKAVDAYSIGALAREIWKEEGDKKVLSDAMRFTAFDLKLNNLINKDLETRSSISDVMMRLTSSPYSLRVPECCFCHAI
jgi:serine/threonine protein kinase